MLRFLNVNISLIRPLFSRIQICFRVMTTWVRYCDNTLIYRCEKPQYSGRIMSILMFPNPKISITRVWFWYLIRSIIMTHLSLTWFHNCSDYLIHFSCNTLTIAVASFKQCILTTKLSFKRCLSLFRCVKFIFIFVLRTWYSLLRVFYFTWHWVQLLANDHRDSIEPVSWSRMKKYRRNSCRAILCTFEIYPGHISLKIARKTPHSLPVRARYGLSFVNTKFGRGCIIDIVVLCVITRYKWSRYVKGL